VPDALVAQASVAAEKVVYIVIPSEGIERFLGAQRAYE
jgi:hypothetical protein